MLRICLYLSCFVSLFLSSLSCTNTPYLISSEEAKMYIGNETVIAQKVDGYILLVPKKFTRDKKEDK